MQTEEIINFDLPSVKPASIKVIGVGGGGGNAVNHMFERGIKDVEFILCNTDAQALAASHVPLKIHLGENTTHGRGAGNNARVGRESAIEAISEIERVLADNTQMVFITAGMGGGTGTGAAPIIAKTAKELGILTVAIVTVPFKFEGKHRITQALNGLQELQENVDSLLVINNEKLREMYGNLALSDAFTKADDILAVAAKGIAEIITVPGKVNVDFADVFTVMNSSGVAIMGSGTASGPNRAIDAISQALNSPLLNNAEIKGAKNILLNFTSGEKEITMDEMSDITDYIIDNAGQEVNMIWGSVREASMTDELRVTIIATGFEMENLPDFSAKKVIIKEKIDLSPQNSTDFAAKKSVPEMEVFFNGSNDFEESRIFNSDPMPEIKLINTPAAKTDMGRNLRQPATAQKIEGRSEWSWGKVKEQEDITAWEKVPAFMRKQQPQQGLLFDEESIEDDGRQISRFRLSNDVDGIRLRDNNSFLEDNVD